MHVRISKNLIATTVVLFLVTYVKIMLHRAPVTNALILAFIIYFATQIYQEFIQLPNEEVNRYQLPLEEYKVNPKLKMERKSLKRKQTRPKLQQVEKERDLFKKLLWESNLRNILAGLDEFSPLLRALPRVYAQDDPELIEIIKEKYLIHPLLQKAQKIAPYHIQATQDTSMGQAQTIRRILNEKVLYNSKHEHQKGYNPSVPRCGKITEKVSFGHIFPQKLAVKQCYQAGQFH